MRDPATKEEWLQSLRIKQQRITWLPYWVWAIVLGIALAGAMRFAYAEPSKTYTNGEGDTVTLYETPCITTVGFFEDMPDNLRAQFQAAVVHWKGTDYTACWILAHEKHFVVDDTGDRGFIEDGPFSPRPKGASEI